jgi:dTMP kinase
MQRGIFITFEGPEGGGKSTQVKRFIEHLQQENCPVVHTREPGGTNISEKIRHIVLDPNNKAMENKTEMLLYAAARSQHVAEIIRPALEQGNIVVCDRFIDASVAYQGYGLGISIEEIIKINAFATNDIVPDRTYLMDLPVELGMQRIAETRGHNEDLQAVGLDRIESKGLMYHRKVREGFLDIAKLEPKRITVVDASRTVAEIAAVVWQDFCKLIEDNRDSII